MILCWGDVGWDEYEDEDAPRPGGCALNVAHQLLKGDHEVSVVGPVGEDGRALIDLLAGWGADVSGLEVLGAPTPRQRILLREGGERVLCGHRGGALVGYTPGETARRLLAEADLVYVPVWQTTLPWLELLWTLREGPVALDLMDLEDLDESTVEDLIARARVVFMGLSERTRALDRFAPMARRLETEIVITLGAGGALRLCGEVQQFVAAAPLPRSLVDTTGCGDAFAGTYLGYPMIFSPPSEAAPESVLRAMLSASASAAQVATHRGAVDVRRP